LQKLAEELEVNSKTIEYALNLLEAEGLLVGQGAGRKRRIGKGGRKGKGVEMERGSGRDSVHFLCLPVSPSLPILFKPTTQNLFPLCSGT
jgi:hypothetical protein